MKKLLLVTTLLLTVSAHSKDDNDLDFRVCAAQSKTAKMIMAYRQKNKPMSALMNISKGKKVFIDRIISAYEGIARTTTTDGFCSFGVVRNSFDITDINAEFISKLLSYLVDISCSLFKLIHAFFLLICLV